MTLKRPIAITALLVVLYTVTVYYAADWLSWPDLLNRAGALLSAVGAALVVYQTLFELRLDTQQATEEHVVTSNNLSPFNAEQAMKIMRRRAEVRTRRRMEMVMCVAILVFMGELLHGWGDLIFFPASLAAPR